MTDKKKRKEDQKLKREFRNLDRTIDKNINEMNNSIYKFTTIAAESKEAGLKDQYKKAILCIQSNISARKFFISRKMDLHIAYENHNRIKFAEDFVKYMCDWSKSIRKISKRFSNFKFQENMDNAMESSEQFYETMSEIEDSLTDSFSNMVGNDSKNGVSVDVAEKLVDSYIVNKGKNKNDMDINKELESLEREFKND